MEENPSEILEKICQSESYHYSLAVERFPEYKKNAGRKVFVINLLRDILTGEYNYSPEVPCELNFGIGFSINNLKKNNISDKEILNRINKVRNSVLNKKRYNLCPHERLCCNHHHEEVYKQFLRELEG